MEGKIKWIIGCLIATNIFSIGYIFYTNEKKNSVFLEQSASPLEEEKEAEAEDQPVLKDKGEKSDQEDQVFQVYVCGAVKHPKIVELPKESRLHDAIEMAGGLLPEADLQQLNLAAHIKDGEKIYIPLKGEIMESNNIATQSMSGSSLVSQSKININTAGIEELDKLPGIGPSTAQAIISYREQNGGFKGIDEIKNVPRIGEARYEQIKDLITID